MTFIIRTDGSVQAALHQSDIPNPEIGRCAARVVESLRFPPHALPVTVRYPIVFTPGGS